MGWFYLTHPDVDGPSLIPDSPVVLRLFESRGWSESDPPEGLDLNDPGAQSVLTELLAGGPVRLPEPAAAVPEDDPAEPDQEPTNEDTQEGNE